jgi:hypothetical protein
MHACLICTSMKHERSLCYANLIMISGASLRRSRCDRRHGSVAPAYGESGEALAQPVRREEEEKECGHGRAEEEGHHQVAALLASREPHVLLRIEEAVAKLYCINQGC